jgi:uncharacterized protein
MRKTPAMQVLTDAEIDQLQAQLESVPEPLEPLSPTALDGFLCGVLLQPRSVAPRRFMPLVTDAQGRREPAGFDTGPIRAAVSRRHAELQQAIDTRRWFDPWVVEPAGAEWPDAERIAATVRPWVTGFAIAMEHFPELIDADDPELTHPLALLFRHLGSDELEDAQEVQEEIAELEPPASLEAAVEDLVRATLQLADARDARIRSTAGRRRSPSE